MLAIIAAIANGFGLLQTVITLELLPATLIVVSNESSIGKVCVARLCKADTAKMPLKPQKSDCFLVRLAKAGYAKSAEFNDSAIKSTALAFVVKQKQPSKNKESQYFLL